MNRTKVGWGLVSLMLLVTVIISAGGVENSSKPVSPAFSPTPSPEIKDNRDLSRYGTVDYSAAENSTADRFLASRRYDNQGWVAPRVYPGVDGVGRNTEDPLPPSLPIGESPTIVVGEITKAVAYLSNDKRGVYTEFTIRVDETLKSDNTVGKTVIADRDGGVVIYPGGQRVLYQDSNIKLPKLGRIYLLFLTRDESPNFKVLTAYELKDGKVQQMELRQDGNPLHEKEDKDFLQVVKETIRQLK